MKKNRDNYNVSREPVCEDAPCTCEPKPTHTPMLWDIWPDKFISKIPWRMKTPIGILSYKRKRDAIAAKNEYIARAEGV